MTGGGILVGLSGGVDSAFAARYLQEKGFYVEGAYLSNGYDNSSYAQALSVAGALGIPLYRIDVSDAFRNKVVQYFIAEYASGRTPNPCVFCNKVLKFRSLLDEADRRGLEYIATGHYARVLRDHETGRFTLHRGIDAAKDQSYFLYRLGQEELSRLRFPNGIMTKESVIRSIGQLKFPDNVHRDSQEICFIPDGDYRRFIENAVAADLFSPGPIMDLQGRIVGRHRGIHSITVGQRRGLSIASERPYYVISILSESNTVVVGREEDQFSTGLTARDVSWIDPDFPLPAPFHAITCIRYRHRGAGSTVTILSPAGDRVSLVFDRPQKAVAPGQSAVFYRGDVVLGGGTIEEGLRHD